MMQRLNFPIYEFSVRQQDEQTQIFDPVRKRFVALTPEEWVRQHVIRYLLDQKGFPSGLLSVEGTIKLYHTKKRYDIAAFDQKGKPLLVVECKSPDTKLNPVVIDQVTRYNLTLQAPYLFITNGIVQIFLKKAGKSFVQMNKFPEYQEISVER
jgi:type I site-specific restriction endonuclease